MRPPSSFAQIRTGLLSGLLSSVLGSLFLISASTSLAATCKANSPATTTVLVDLYTSEGCNSCPPADKWLSALKNSGLVPAQVVPLAFHVDYWDYIGWRDRFASPLFSRRQSELVKLSGSNSVYTPQVLLAGRTFREWSNTYDFLQKVREQSAQPAKAALSLQLASNEAGAWTGELSGTYPIGQSKPGNLQAYLAIYESGLSSDVRAGENNGKRLKHDYVVRELIGPLAVTALAAVASSTTPLKNGSGSGFQTSIKLPEVAGINRANAGVAAFLQDGASGEIYQAVSLGFCL